MAALDQPLAIIRLETHRYRERRLRSASSFASWLTAIAGISQQLVLLIPTSTDATDGQAHDTYSLRATDKLLALPICRGYVRAFLALPAVAFQLVRARTMTSILLVRAPEHLNLLLLPLTSLLRFNTTIWLVGDRSETHAAENARKPTGLRSSLGSILSKLTGAMERHYLRRVPVITNGTALRAQLIRAGADPTRLMPIVSSTMRRGEMPTATPRRTIATPIRLLYVGRIAPEKGLADLLVAIKHLQVASPAIRKTQLTIVGWSAHGELERLRNSAAAMGIHDHLTIAGPIQFGPDLFREYSKADIFVLPSWIEGTPRVLIEAMAFGLPIVATNVGGIPDVITHLVNGILVPPKSPEGLAQAINDIASQPTLAQTMRDNNSSKARNHTVESVAEAMHSFVLSRAKSAT